MDRISKGQNIFKKKFVGFLPVMILTNVSTLILLQADNFVVSNIVGQAGLGALNILGPFVQMSSIFATLLSRGISITYSHYIGCQDDEGLSKTKRAARLTTIFFTIFLAIIQFPIAFGMMAFLNPSPELLTLSWNYAIGVMIAVPVSVVTTINTFELQVLGKMKMLLFLTVVEGGSNLILDMLFVGVFGMGTAGAGFGTAVAVIIRALIGVSYVYFKTDLHKNEKTGCLKQVKEIIKSGMPEAVEFLAIAITAACMNKTVIFYFGEAGLAIYSICMGCKSLGLMIVNGIISSLRPLINLIKEAINIYSMRQLIRYAFLFNAILVGAFVALVIIVPGVFFRIYGNIQYNEFGIMSLRIFIPMLLIVGFTKIIRLYFSTEEDTRFISAITLIFESIVPLLVAFLIARSEGGPWFWGAYFVGYIIELFILLPRYFKAIKRKRKNDPKDELLIYLSQQKASETAEIAQNYMLEHGQDPSHSNLVALCLEEMASSAVGQKKGKEASIVSVIRIYENYMTLVILDDGEYVGLNEKKISSNLITDSYELVLKISKEIKYDYILNMNLTKIRI